MSNPHNATIEVCNELGYDIDTNMLVAVLSRAAHHIAQATSIRIYVDKRLPTGWIEYIMAIEYKGGGRLTIGAIQRELGGQYEFHS